MSENKIEIIRHSAPSEWMVSCCICVDWYDGMESGFVVLNGPEQVGFVIERVGETRTSTIYHAWLLPDCATDLIGNFGAVATPNADWQREFTADAPMDVEVINEIVKLVNPQSFLIALDGKSRKVLLIAVVDRAWTALPSSRAFGIES